jgi:hypothetical protein
MQGAYGSALSTVPIATNGSATGLNDASLTGTFTWTTGATLVGDAGPRTHSMTYTPGTTGASSNYGPVTENVSITVNNKPVTITVGNVSRALSPLDTTATFTVTVNGLVGSHAVTVNLDTNSYGLSLATPANNTGITNNQARTITMTYDGTTEVTTAALSVGLDITQAGNSYYTLSGSPAVAPTVCDGGAAGARAIPVTQANIVRSSPDGFNAYANTVTGRSKHYKLAEDVTLTAPASGGSNWTPIMGFTGTFDGQCKTITGLTINSDARYVGMFGSAGGSAVIQNLGLINVNIVCSPAGYVGGVAGTITGRVEKCFVTGSVSNSQGNSGDYTGGVVGNIWGTLQNCYSAANVRGRIAGGVVGQIYGSGTVVQYCYATGSVSNAVNASYSPIIGGVVSTASSQGQGTLTKCVALNSSISSSVSTSTLGRVYSPIYLSTGLGSYNYGIPGIPAVGSQSNINGHDGETTSTVSGNVKNPATQAFWTTPSNWGGEAWDTTIWDVTNVGTLTPRPILRGFTAGMQGE